MFDMYNIVMKTIKADDPLNNYFSNNNYVTKIDFTNRCTIYIFSEF